MNIARNSFVVFASKIAVGVLLFLSQIILARILGPEGLGVYNLFLAITGSALLLGGLGFGTASIYLLNKEKKNFSELFSNSIFFGAVWGAAISLIVFLLYFIFPGIFSGLSYKYILFALLTIPLVILYNYCLPLLIAQFRILAWSVFSVLYAAFILCLSVILVVFARLGVDGAVYAVLATVLANFVLIIFYLFRTWRIKWYPSTDLFWKQLKFGMRTYLGEIFSTINFKLNIFIINIFMGVLSVGYYSVSYNIAALVFVVPFSLQQVLYPAWSSASEEEVDQKTPAAARQAFLIGLVAAFFLMLAGRFFILLFYGREFLPSITPFYLILPGGVFAAYAGIFFNNFFAKGKPHVTSYILLGSLALNVALSIILIPRMEVSGAALAGSASYFFSAIIAMILFHRMSRKSWKEIMLVKRSDLQSVCSRFLHLFTSVGKVLGEISSRDVKGLKEYYENKAGQYDVIGATFESKHFYKKVFYAMRVKIIMDMLALKQDERILEIGCGEGYYTKKLLEATPDVFATDISEKFLEKAKKNTDSKACEYTCCPSENLPYPDGYFDKILMSEVIEHLLDWRQGIKEAYRVLKPGGVIVISTPNKLSYLNVLCHLKILIKNEPLVGDHIREFSRKELTRLMPPYFKVEAFGYSNYFPAFLLKFIGLQKTEKIISFLERVLGRIIFVRDAGLIFFLKAKKQ